MRVYAPYISIAPQGVPNRLHVYVISYVFVSQWIFIDEYDLLLMISKTMSIHMRSKEAMKLNMVKTIVECEVT